MIKNEHVTCIPVTEDGLFQKRTRKEIKCLSSYQKKVLGDKHP